MGRKKHIRIAEVRNFPNVFDFQNETTERDLQKYFSNTNPITIELGCGQADYSINLAQQFPQRNFIGIDRKPNRLWSASKNAQKVGITNVAFLIAYGQKLAEVFKTMKVFEIWITFPDPYPRNGSIKKRMTHPIFLNVYKSILAPAGKIILKTDDDTLYEYTLKMIEEERLNLHFSTDNLYAIENLSFEKTIKTKYEKMHLENGKKIKLITFSITQDNKPMATA
jgi:tRNA (guanine-N7-)-methyltransferase